MYVNISVSKDYMSTSILEHITYVFVGVVVSVWQSMLEKVMIMPSGIGNKIIVFS